MRPARFEALLADAARHVPVVDGVKTLADAGHTEHPFGVAVHLRDGSQAWWSFTVQSRSGDSYAEPESEPISGERPEPIAMPDFPADPVEMSDLELALAAQLLALDTNAEIKEIQRFSQRPDKGAIPYGLKVVFHPGGSDTAKAFVNSLATVRPGQDAPRGRWYEVPATV
jgi:hypothetical protein